jgi:hypothetical protein
MSQPFGGMMICKHCNGKGEVDKLSYIKIYDDTCFETNMCPVCLGHKTMDWLELITGKKRYGDSGDPIHGLIEEFSHPTSNIIEACVI